jgi:V/A-type H+-transporting ATPase subunit K
MPLELFNTIAPLEIAAGDLEYFGAALAVGLAALGSGYAERGIGSAAVGAVAEDEDLFVRGLILTVLPETLVIFALLVVFLAL